MPTTIDQLKLLGGVAADAARINLSNHGNLLPVLMIVRDGEVTEILAVPPSPDGISKYNAYRLMGYLLNAKAPDAVIMVSDAYMRVLKREEAQDFLDHYDGENLSTDTEAVESIVIAFKGPTIGAHILAIPYHRNEVGDIVFDHYDSLQDWRDGAEMNLLPDWWYQ